MSHGAVLFDVGCVLINPQPRHFAEAVRAVTGDVLPPGVALRALAQTVWTGALDPFPSQFWDGKGKARAWAGHAGQREADGPAIWAELERLDTEFDPLWSVLSEGATALLATLRDEGFRLAAVSNSSGDLEARLRVHAIDQYFDVILDSGVEGVAKPEPEIFRRAARRLDVSLERCVFVGDDPHFDVAASVASGVGRAVLFDRYRLRSADWTSPAIERLEQLPALVR